MKVGLYNSVLELDCGCSSACIEKLGQFNKNRDDEMFQVTGYRDEIKTVTILVLVIEFL